MPNRSPQSTYSKLKRPEHYSLVDIAYNVLVEAIVNQEFKPGAQISIDSLAKQLGMSNTPVREALMRAKGERLVEQKTNHGFVVAGILTPDALHEMFDVRHALELHAAKAALITDEAVQELTRLVQHMTSATDGAVYVDFKEFLALDHQFHRILVGLANNSFLLKAWQDLHVHLHLSRIYTGVGLIDRDDALIEHQGILAAVQQRDKEEMARLLSQHILRVETRLGSFLAR
jgi:DNA-binding GntR family transcriptional regulator